MKAAAGVTAALLLGGCALWPGDAPVEAPAPEGEPTLCTEAEHEAFDFSLGDWDVTLEVRERGGHWSRSRGRAEIRRAMRGCAVIEELNARARFYWTGSDEELPLTALSVRRYDSERGHWWIHWTDALSPSMNSFSGEFASGLGVFERSTPRLRAQTRMVYANIGPDRYDWEFAIAEGEDGWRTLWRMRYRRR